MTKIFLVCGFLGSGKTTFIQEVLSKKDNSLIYAIVENEFGEVNIDSKILANSNIAIKEITNGCICCSLIGDFSKAILELKEKYQIDIIIIEPSGVAEISPLIHTLQSEELFVITIIDAKRHLIYEKNFKSFYEDQIFCADKIFFSKTDELTDLEIENLILDIKDKHGEKDIEFRNWHELNYNELFDIEGSKLIMKNSNHQDLKFYEKTLRPQKYFEIKEIEKIGEKLKNSDNIYRVKGFLDSFCGKLKIDYTQGEFNYEKIDYMPENFLIAIGTSQNIEIEIIKILGDDIES
ncbi:MAG: GTP-binding protein [Tissierellia bacterium]|nr:GTP-binding protein [Tissierellia bacterium]